MPAAWRLSQGPIDITSLVQREQYRFDTGGARLAIGSAALAWEGFFNPDSLLDIRFGNVRIADAAGAPLADLPEGRVALAVAPLWRGALVPRTVILDRPSVTLHRAADGTLKLDFGPREGAPKGPHGTHLLADLTGPHAMPFLAGLRRVRLDHAALVVRDTAAGVLWRADTAAIVLDRQADGSITGATTLDLGVGDARISLAAEVALRPGGLDIDAGFATPLSPAALARAVPGLAPLAAVDAPLTAALTAHFDAAFALRDAALALGTGAGRVSAGRGVVAIDSASAMLRTDGGTVSLSDARIALRRPPDSRSPAPVLTGHAEAHRQAGGWQAVFAVAVDHVAFADLPAYWPPGTGGGAQPWITQNITAGTAQDVRVTGALTAAADGGDPRLTALGGGLDGRDMTLGWLRPIPPIEHADARLAIDGTDALHIDVVRGNQGPLKLSDGAIRIVGLSQKDQFGTITTRIGGPLPDVLALLNHPRLKLLSRRPIPLNQPRGMVDARLTVKLPLDAFVTFDDIGIAATAKLSDVHLGAVAAGRDLDDGILDLAVDTDQLTIGGDGKLAGVPARLGLMMDFRNGPARQVLEQLSAVGRATAAQLDHAGMPDGLVTGGTAGFDIDYAALRDGTGSVAARLDLRDAAIATPFGWSKPAGAAGHASARLLLLHDRLAGIEQAQADGPGLALMSHVETVAGRPSRLVLDRVEVGRTSAHGSIGMPGGTDPSWRVFLRGTSLDVSAALRRRDTGNTADEDDETPGPPWQVDLAFDRVVLARDEALAPVMLRADNDGLRMTQLAVTAGAGGPGGPGGPGGQVRASIVPRPGGRVLRVDASDAGAVLLASGVADNIRGGALKVDGTYDDRAPHAPLSGTATLEHFRVTDAPAIGRLLKLMTFYGAVDLLRGPGLGFQKAVAPFQWRERVLTLRGARAFSASLGVTAAGDIDLRHRVANVHGTIVPAYFFNQLLGRIPLVGKLFSPEPGGGVFAARYTVTGTLADPKVGVNPLSALTPGFLRGIFGVL